MNAIGVTMHLVINGNRKVGSYGIMEEKIFKDPVIGFLIIKGKYRKTRSDEVTSVGKDFKRKEGDVWGALTRCSPGKMPE